MFNNFRKNHILKIFKGYESAQKQPIDAYFNHYLRKNKAIGSNDRKFISESIFSIIRHLGFIDAHFISPATWDDRVNFFFSGNIATKIKNSKFPPHIKLSFPKELYTLLVKNFGAKKTRTFCEQSNIAAPVMIRINTLKTTRDRLFRSWKDSYNISLCPHSKDGIIFHKKINFYTLSEFKSGLFEVQDEASQLIGNLVLARPGEEVLDFCAGAGGKSLCIAPNMENKGQIYLHDIRKGALISAKKRLKRAGIQNAQIIFESPKRLKRLKNRMDWVLVDAPCSGSGTYRRNPDQKWKFSQEMLDNVIADQRTIFDDAIRYLKPKGKIVYATCSVLIQENQEQMNYFCEKYQLTPVGTPFTSLPSEGCMDGFFGIVLKRI